MATIDKRTYPNSTTKYRARTRLKGFPSVTASFARLTDAKRWAAATESAQREGRHFASSEAKRHTFAELIQRYQREVLPTKPKSARSQKTQLDWWRTQLGPYSLADVTPAKIAECRDRLRNMPMPNGELRSPATAVRYLAVLSHAFGIAMKEWGWVDDNPLRKVSKPKEPAGRVRWLDDDERDRLLAACRQSKSKSLYPIVVLALSTGMRKGEMLGLRWSHVDFGRGHITLHETKNGDRRGIPLVGLASDLLQNLYDERPGDSDLMFPSPTTSKSLDISKAWNTALVAAGVENFRFHDLRHSAASYLVMNGATFPEVGELLGHKTTQMTKRYAHIANGHTKQMVASMNERIFR